MAQTQKVVVDPAWEAVCSARTAQLAQLPGAANTVEGIRAASEGFLQMLQAPLPEGMEETTHTFKSTDGTAEITLIRHFPPSAAAAATAATPQRALVYAHGGGLIATSAALSVPLSRRIAQESATQTFSVEYRLAPEHRQPAAVEDLLAAVQWLQTPEVAAKFGIDPARIVLMGCSGGAGAAAGAALLARDRGSLTWPIAGLLLEYPMLDDRTTTAPDDAEAPYHAWPEESNDVAWAAYTGVADKAARTTTTTADDGSSNSLVSYYAAPARCGDLRGLPPTFVNVTGLDLFKRECVAFVGRLAEANVETEFHLYPGVGHAFDMMLPQHRHAKELADNEFRFIGRF